MLFSSNVVRVAESPFDDATTSKINTILCVPNIVANKKVALSALGGNAYENVDNRLG